MPQNEMAARIVDNLDPVFLNQIKALVVKRVLKHPKEDGSFNGVPYFIIGDSNNGTIALWDKVKKSLLYFVHYRKVAITGNLAGRQVLLWRDKASAASAGFAQHVFFSILLPRFGTLISDRLQTQQGAGFWQFSVKTVFHSSLNLKVYLYLDKPQSLFELTSYQDMIDHEDKIWGSSPSHENCGLIITSKTLKLGISPKQRIKNIGDVT